MGHLTKVRSYAGLRLAVAELHRMLNPSGHVDGITFLWTGVGQYLSTGVQEQNGNLKTISNSM